MSHKFTEAGSPHRRDLNPRSRRDDAGGARFSGLPVFDKAPGPSRSLNVCILAADFIGPVNNGGIGTAFRYLAEFLVECGHAVTVLYAPGNHCENGKIKDWVMFYKKRGITFVPLPVPQVPATNGPMGQACRVSYSTYEWLKNKNFDLVHVSEWHAVGYFCLLAKSLGLEFQHTLFCVKASSPTVWSQVGGGQPLANLHQTMVSYMEQRSMELADIAVSGSRHLLDWMLDYGYNLSRDRCFVQPNLMGTDTLPVAANTYKPGKRVKVDEIVFFGRLEARKGLHIFCSAITQLVRSGIVPKKIFFLGKEVTSFPARKFIRQQSENWPMEWEIISDYDQPQAIGFLQKESRVAVIPSLLENSSFAIYECLSYAIPFLASDRGGNPELIARKHHKNILFAAQPNALSKQLAKTLQSGALVAEASFDNDKNRDIWRDWHIMLGRKGEIEKFGSKLSPSGKPAQKVRPAQKAKQPLVSVCLAHYERPELVHQTIASLKQQTYRNFEVILVDDGSHSAKAKDNLLAIEKDFKKRGWKVVYQENLYLGASRNTAARHAKGKYLLFMDDDNFAKQHEIETFVHIAESSSADILTCFSDAFTGLETPDDDQVIHRITPLGANVATGMFLNVFGDSNCFVRRTSFRKIGGFTEDFGVGLDDQEFFARAILSGLKLEVVPEALYFYRLPTGKGLKKMHYNVTAGKLRVLGSYMKAVPPVFQNALLYAVGMESKSSKRKPAKLAANPRKFYAESHIPWLRPFRHFHGDNAYGRFNTKILRWFLATFFSNEL